MTQLSAKAAVQNHIISYLNATTEHAKDLYASAAYDIMDTQIWTSSKKADAASKLHGTKDDAASLFGFVFAKALTTYKPIEPFAHYVNRMISNAIIDEGLKRVKRINDHELQAGAKTDRNVRTINDLKRSTIGDHTFESPIEFDDELTPSEREKMDKQVMVLGELLAKADEFDRTVAIEYMRLGSYGKVATHLETSKPRVMRALSRIGRTYDEQKHGNYCEMFTVNTTKTR